jgi:hypothetical protein
MEGDNVLFLDEGLTYGAWGGGAGRSVHSSCLRVCSTGCFITATLCHKDSEAAVAGLVQTAPRFHWFFLLVTNTMSLGACDYRSPAAALRACTKPIENSFDSYNLE